MKYLFALLIGFCIIVPAWAQHRAAPARPTGRNVHIQRPINVHPIAPVGRPRVVVANYHLVHGVRFKFGFYYTGPNHNHWSYHYWDTRYGAYLYYDPYALQYYYWCAPHFRFYPITYTPFNSYSFPYVAQPIAPVVPPPAPPPYANPSLFPPMPPSRN